MMWCYVEAHLLMKALRSHMPSHMSWSNTSSSSQALRVFDVRAVHGALRTWLQISVVPYASQDRNLDWMDLGWVSENRNAYVLRDWWIVLA